MTADQAQRHMVEEVFLKVMIVLIAVASEGAHFTCAQQNLLDRLGAPATVPSSSYEAPLSSASLLGLSRQCRI